jgi:hypothetical protein
MSVYDTNVDGNINLGDNINSYELEMALEYCDANNDD